MRHYNLRKTTQKEILMSNRNSKMLFCFIIDLVSESIKDLATNTMFRLSCFIFGNKYFKAMLL